MQIPVLVHPSSKSLVQIREALRIVNQIQTHFSFRLDATNWLPRGKTMVRPARFRDALKSKHQTPVVVILDGPLYGSVFSMDYRGISMISIADWDEEFAPPPLNIYLASELAFAMASFSGDLTDAQLDRLSHTRLRGCIFDETRGRDEFHLSLVAGHLCAECESYLSEMGAANEAMEAIDRVLAYVRSAAIRRPRPAPSRVFIGHGHSNIWQKLQDFLVNRLQVNVEEFNHDPTAGLHTSERLEEMLDKSVFAVLVMTAEDVHADATLHARENVIHEIGLFQGRLGFKRAIILKEDVVAGFSNVHGLTCIPFPTGRIEEAFKEIARTLIREGIGDAVTAERFLSGG